MIEKRSYMFGFMIAHLVEHDVKESEFNLNILRYCKRYGMTPPSPEELTELARFMEFIATRGGFGVDSV
jgi:hypothetical protein